MATGLNMKMTITGDRAMFERAAKALRNPKPLMQRVGTLALSSSVRRLSSVLKQGDAIRTGRLGASLSPGGEANVFEISDFQAIVGTNLPYAAQVQYGGTILPKNAKALAIPLDPQIARQGLGPREVDPSGDLLSFVPYTGSKPNVFALLIDRGMQGPLTKRKKKREGGTPYGPGPLFALAYWVTQEARPYLYFDEADLKTINGIAEQWLAGK